MLPWRSRPPRIAVVAELDAPEVAAVDVRDAVVLGQALVQERVVRLQQVEHAAILAHDALEQEFRLLAEGLPQVVVEVGEQAQVRGDRIQVPQVQPLAREVASPGSASAGRPACAGPVVRAPRACSTRRARPGRGARRPGCCSRERTTGARRAGCPGCGRPNPARRRAGPLRCGRGTAGSPAPRSGPSRSPRRSPPPRGPLGTTPSASRRSASITGRR